MRSFSGGNGAVWPWGLAAGTISVITGALVNSSGLRLTGDGWAYWQAAVSLAEGRGYRYFSGEPIVTWPPLYSIYLAAWTWLAGPTSLSVAFANTVLLGVQALLWTWCLLRIWQDTEPTPSTITRTLVVVFLGLYPPLHQYFVRADLLFHVMLAPTFYCAWKAMNASSARLYPFALACGCFGALLVATHHRGAVFAVAAAALIASRAIFHAADRRLALAGSATAALLPALTALAIRWGLQQWNSHLTGLTASHETLIDHGRQFIRSLGNLLSSSAPITPRWVVLLWTAALIIVITRKVSPRPFVFAAGFVAIAAVLTLFTFRVTALDDDLDPRFVFFIPLITVPFLLLAADQVRKELAVAVGGLVLVPLIAASLETVAMTRGPVADPRELIIHNTEISGAYLNGPPIKTSRGWLIVPYSWHETDAHVRSRRSQTLQ